MAVRKTAPRTQVARAAMLAANKQQRARANSRTSSAKTDAKRSAMVNARRQRGS